MQDHQAIRYFSERRLRPLLRLADPGERARRFRRMLSELPEGWPARDD